jgi:S1-C subfamily serine protease
MRGDFDFDDDPDLAPRRPAGTRRYDDEPVESARRPPRRPPAISPLVILSVVGGGVLFLAAVIVAILVVRKASREDEPIANAAPPAQTTPPAVMGPRPANPPPTKKEPEPLAARPTDDVVQKVKRATVRVRVLFRNGRAGSGTGFVEESTNKVLTNAHVLGLIAEKGERKLGPPRAIELVVNSGEPGQYSLGGELIASDPDSDLALLRPYLLEPGARHLVPRGLVVPRSANLNLLDRVLVFGYPFGEQLGTEITVSETSVSSLRKDMATGRLSMVQVRGGMNPGNSGGPVVDVKGNVVGVAVAGIQGTDINFAIPGDVVHAFLAKNK